MNPLRHPFLVVLNFHLAHFWVHVKGDPATIRRLLCAGQSMASSLSLSEKESTVIGVAFFFVVFLLVLSDAVDGDWSG